MSRGASMTALTSALIVAAYVAVPRAADLKSQTVRAWDDYVTATERRIDAELARGAPFLVIDGLPGGAGGKARAVLARGEVFMERLASPSLTGPRADVPSGLVHHWLGALLVRAAGIDEVLAFVQRYDDHARFFSDVAASTLVSREGDRFDVFLRLRRKKIVTVTYNTSHDVRYRHHAPDRASSRSVATRIAELEDAGTNRERERPPGSDSGYLWRLNSYWRFERIEQGVIVECESLTLSRDIPFGFGWLVRPMVEDISRESLERTLSSIGRGVTGATPAREARPLP